MGYCPFLVLCRDREFRFSVVTEIFGTGSRQGRPARHRVAHTVVPMSVATETPSTHGGCTARLDQDAHSQQRAYAIERSQCRNTVCGQAGGLGSR